MRNKKYDTIWNWKHLGITFYDKADEDYIYNYYINTTHCENCLKEFKNRTDRQLDHCHLLNEIRGIICHKCNQRTIENCPKVIKCIEKTCKQGFMWRFILKRDGKIIVNKKSYKEIVCLT